MGAIIKDTIKTSLINYVGIVIGALNLLWLQAAFLSEEEIGVIRYLLDVVALLMPFFMLGTNGVATRYFHHFKKDNQAKQTLFTFLFSIPLVSTLIFLIVYLIFSTQFNGFFEAKSQLVESYYGWILPLILIQLFITLIESVLIANRNLVVPYFLKNICLRLVMSALVLMYHYDVIGFDLLINSYFFSHLIQLLILGAYLKRSVGFTLKPSFDFKKYPIFKEIIIYCLFLILGASGSMLVSKLDTVMTEHVLRDLAQVGVYSVAFFIAVLIETPQRALMQIIFPMMSELNTLKDNPKIQELYQKSAVNLFILGSLLFLLVWYNIKDLYGLIPNGETYQQGIYVVFFIGLAKVFDMFLGPTSQVLAASKYYRYNFYLLPFLGVLTILTNLYFIPIYNITGTAIATSITILVYSILRYIMVLRLMKMNSLSASHLGVVGSILIVVLFFELVPLEFSNELLAIIVKSSILTLLFLCLNYLFKSSEELSKIINKYLLRR